MRTLLLVALTVWLSGCGSSAEPPPLLPEDRYSPLGGEQLEPIARIVHISDAHMVDTLSPARFAGADPFVGVAWRPWESCSTQLLDGAIRTANRIHASGRPVDFLVHTGDACDNLQSNELGWFLAVMDGTLVTPLSGPDDRTSPPPPEMDPYAAFQAQGLYRKGVHGDLPSIPWYAVPGNHDVYAIGVFPVLFDQGGIAPLPLSGRPGLWLPTIFDPTGEWSHGNVTPAFPGPVEFLEWPTLVEPNPARAYVSPREFMEAHTRTVSGPIGHGFADPADGPGWYSVAPAPGLRLIGLNTSDQPAVLPGFPYSEGCISAAQLDFLRAELSLASQNGETVILATHHPSQSLDPATGSALSGPDLQALLNSYPNVALHLAGHSHRHRVAIRGGYLEIETASTLDLPQEIRVLELWRDGVDGSVLIGYETFSHLDDSTPALGEDRLRGLREWARSSAQADSAARTTSPEGTEEDRRGLIRLQR